VIGDPPGSERGSAPESRGTTPLVTTGRAAGRWVKWLRAHGEEPEAPVAPAAGAPQPDRPGRHAAPPTTGRNPPESRLSPSGAGLNPPGTGLNVPGPTREPGEPIGIATAPTGPTRDRAAHSVDDELVPQVKDPAQPQAAGSTDGGWRSYVRPGLLVVGALGIQLAFILSYVGAWHAPVADGLPVAVVTSASADRFQAQVDRDSDTVGARHFTGTGAAFDALADQDVYAVLTSGSGGLELHLASAASGAAAESLTQVYGRVSTVTGTRLAVYDDHPLPATDNRGISPFYLVVGWVVGGYLVSTLLSFIAGAHPQPRRGRIRALSLLAYAVCSGIGGAVIVGPVLGIWHDGLIPLAALGVLVVFGASITAVALSALFGSVGTGLTILLLVVLGNPGSGGPFAPEMLPGPFRGLHTWLLTGAATTAARSVVYFAGQGAAREYLVLLLWCAIGSLLYLASITLRGRRRRPTT